LLNNGEDKMPESRYENINAIIRDIVELSENMSGYSDDLEPQAAIDNYLTGKVTCLIQYFKTFGWLNLSTILEGMIPFNATASVCLDTIKSFVIPEAKRLMEITQIEITTDQLDGYWELVHPRIKNLARPRFYSGFYADAVESAFKEINDITKGIVLEKTGRELDGANLMTTAFSPNNPIIKLNSLASETDQSIQQGYMQILAGSITGIRNPKAHSNLTLDKNRTLHLIFLASLLMYKIDERI
jgi:uncharacterized protein (TIGR02391 family)